MYSEIINQIKMGFGNFYATTAREYIISPGFNNVYNTRGTLEWDANKYANNLGYYEY
jgi:hypothetical protein